MPDTADTVCRESGRRWQLGAHWGVNAGWSKAGDRFCTATLRADFFTTEFDTTCHHPVPADETGSGNTHQPE